jgi:hypothetical protein
MQETLVKDTEQRISDGFQEIANEQQVGEHQPSSISPQPSSVSPQPSEQEPTKGVQTYIPMSDYLRLNTIKCHRGETIGNLVAQAIGLWLDVQEGKRKVSETI